MSSRYQKPFAIPEGFPALLKEFCREVLRAQPANVFDFGARYFAEKKLHESDVPVKKEARGPRISVDETIHTGLEQMEEAMLELFMAADKDKSGALDRKEFTAVLMNANLGVTPRHVRQLLADCDENEDGVIEYREFIPVMLELLSAGQAANEAAQATEEQAQAIRDSVEEFLLYGMPKNELEDIMLKTFTEADKDGSGSLDRKEFKQCLRSAALGLTRKDINMLMSKVDVDANGLVDYSEFLPICFSILVERFADQMLASETLASEDLLLDDVLQRFQAVDTEGNGMLTGREAKSALEEMSEDVFAMSQYQIHALLAVAPIETSGRIHATRFAPTVVATIRSWVDVDTMQKRFRAVQQLGETEAMQAAVGAFSAAEFEAMLHDAFVAADIDNSGALTGREITNVLREVAQAAGDGNMQLSPGLWQSMMASVDCNDDGTVEWEELVFFMSEIAQHVAKEKRIAEISNA